MKKIMILFLMIFSFMSFGGNPEKLFERRCSSCHTIGGGKDVGPDLKGMTERQSEEWITKFIRDSKSVIDSGDKYAVELFEKFGKKKMPKLKKRYSDADIKELIVYIGKKSKEPAQKKVMALKEGSLADKIANGRILSARCSQCHGNVGISSNPKKPNLKGQHKSYLVDQMIQYREGKRVDPTGAMNGIAKVLDDVSIENISLFYESLGVK